MDSTRPVAADRISAASRTTLTGRRPPLSFWAASANTLAPAAFENATSVHAPTDIGLRTLKTRSMFRNRSGLPRSEIRRAGEIAPPIAAIHRASRTSPGSAPAARATAATTAEAPAVPPTKKYAGISHVQTGAFSSGRS